jgi:hypothetical protein
MKFSFSFPFGPGYIFIVSNKVNPLEYGIIIPLTNKYNPLFLLLLYGLANRSSLESYPTVLALAFGVTKEELDTSWANAS